MDDKEERFEDALDALDSLLSITERFKEQMDAADRKEWQRISAWTADERAYDD